MRSDSSGVRFLRVLAVVIGLAPASLGPAHAGLSVGVNDDAAGEAASAAWFFPTMQAEGLTVDTVTVRWDESEPATVSAADASSVGTVVAAAARAGVAVELDLYPLHAAALTDGIQCASAAGPLQCGDSVRIRRFASWTAQVARMFPTV